MLDRHAGADWWKKIIQHFVKQGDEFEIRCWNEEHEAIKKALSYGRLSQDESHFEKSIKGVVSEQMLKELLAAPERTGQTIEHKMTEYFTIMIKDKISSEHDGTELYLFNLSDHDVEIFNEIMAPYRKSFSMSIEEQSRENL